MVFEHSGGLEDYQGNVSSEHTRRAGSRAGSQGPFDMAISFTPLVGNAIPDSVLDSRAAVLKDQVRMVATARLLWGGNLREA